MGGGVDAMEVSFDSVLYGTFHMTPGPREALNRTTYTLSSKRLISCGIKNMSRKIMHGQKLQAAVTVRDFLGL